nr:hypothetical protein [Tanacetum cinerariifolium]
MIHQVFLLILLVQTKFKPYKNSSKEIAASNSNQEKDKPPQDSDIHQLIREECCTKDCREQKKNMEDTMLDLIEVCRQKELYCMHNDVVDLIESALNSKLLLINLESQHLDKEKQEVKNSLISLNNTSQIYSVHAITPILSTEEPEYSLSIRYKHINTTLETKSDKIIKSGVEELVPFPREYEVTSKDKRECDVLVCEDSSTFDISDNHSEILSDSNNDEISSDDDAFEDIEYVETLPLDSELVRLEEENDVYQEEEEFNLEDIQDVILREKLLSINRLIANIESLNDNPTPDRMLNSSTSIPIFEESDNSLSDNFSPEFKTFSDNTEETRSGSTNTHAYNSLPEYDSFCFEIEPDQERLTSIVINDIYDDSSNDPLLEEVDLFLASDNSIPSGIEKFGYDSERDIHFLEELLIDDSIPLPNNESSDWEDDPLFPRPPPKPPDVEFFFNSKPEVISVMKNNIEELNKDNCFDPGGEIDVSTHVKDDNYFPFILSILSLNHFVEIPSGEIKVHIDVLSVLWGNRLPIRMVRCRCLDVLEVYMHQLWDTIHKYDNSYRFRMDKKKKFNLNLEIFRDLFHICPRVHGQDIDKLPNDEDIVSFFKELVHTRESSQLPMLLLIRCINLGEYLPLSSTKVYLERQLTDNRDDSNNDHDSNSKGNDKASDNRDKSTQSKSEKGYDFEHETDKNESGFEFNHEKNEEDVEDDKEENDDKLVKTSSNSADDEDETNVEDEGDEDKGMEYTTNQFDDDVDEWLNEPVNTDEGFIQKEGTDAEIINVQQGKENLEITLNQVIADA